MGLIVNATLLIVGTVCICCGFHFFTKEKTAGFTRMDILMMGIFAGTWCYGFGLMGMADAERSIRVSRCIGFLAIAGYLGWIFVLVLRLIQVHRLLWIVAAVACVVNGIVDVCLMAVDKGHEFVKFDGRTAYYIRESTLAYNYHRVYVSIIFITMCVLAVFWYFGKRTRENRQFIVVMVLSHVFLMISCIPDTVLPSLGLPSFPASCFGVCIGYLLFWYYCVNYNALNITVGNVSDYVYESTQTPILVFDTDKRLYMANDTACQFLKLNDKKDKGRGMLLSDLFLIGEQGGEGRMEEILNGELDELRLQTRTGRISCSIRFTVPVNKKNQPYCIIAFVYDLTRDEEIMEELKQANEAKTSFLANMSHEIRTPINAILGMNEMILRESTEEPVLEYAGVIHSSADNLLSIVNDILDISKIEAGRMEIVEAAYQLKDLLTGTWHMVSDRAEKKGLQLIFTCQETLPAKLCGDEIRMKQVLMNLLTNAIKYTETGIVELVVTGVEKEDICFLKFDVKDTGIGIRKEDQKKLFGKFQRFDLERNRSVEGTGLGLNITGELVRQMGGRVSAESEYGKGSCFTAEIPQLIIGSGQIGNFRAEEEDARKKGSEYSRSFTAPDARILVVDDVEINLKVVRNLLKATEVQVDTAQSGAECLEKIRQSAYDLILMDHMMPVMDGIETLHKMYGMEHLCKGVPVIMLTANAINGAEDMYRQEGFTDYITKPVKGERLEEKLAEYLPAEKICMEKKTDIQEEEKMAEGTKGLEGLKERIADISIEQALSYCAGSEEFYLELLNDYCENGKGAVLEEKFSQKNWEEYRVEVHALKSTSRTLGLIAMGDTAEKLEMACKAGDFGYVEENHLMMEAQLAEVISSIRACL